MDTLAADTSAISGDKRRAPANLLWMSFKTMALKCMSVIHTLPFPFHIWVPGSQSVTVGGAQDGKDNAQYGKESARGGRDST